MDINVVARFAAPRTRTTAVPRDRARKARNVVIRFAATRARTTAVPRDRARKDRNVVIRFVACMQGQTQYQVTVRTRTET